MKADFVWTRRKVKGNETLVKGRLRVKGRRGAVEGLTYASFVMVPVANFPSQNISLHSLHLLSTLIPLHLLPMYSKLSSATTIVLYIIYFYSSRGCFNIFISRILFSVNCSSHSNICVRCIDCIPYHCPRYSTNPRWQTSTHLIPVTSLTPHQYLLFFHPLYQTYTCSNSINTALPYPLLLFPFRMISSSQITFLISPVLIFPFTLPCRFLSTCNE